MKTCYLTRTPSLLQRQRFLDSRLEEDLQAVWDETSKFTEPAGPGGGGVAWYLPGLLFKGET